MLINSDNRPKYPRKGMYESQQIGDFQVLKLLGQGAFGKVFRLLNKSDNANFAFKEMDLKYLQPCQMKRIEREVKNHVQLDHPNIIQLYDWTYANKFFYLILELALCSLHDKIQEGLHTYQCRQYFSDLMSGLDYLHSKGIAHRDLKPANLLIGNDGRIKLADFGLSQNFMDTEIMDWPVNGTHGFMAPEVFVTKYYFLERADIWSCGIILVEMLTQSLPWQEARHDCVEFSHWKNNNLREPFTSMDWHVLHLIKIILKVDPANRATIDEIRHHSWLKS